MITWWSLRQMTEFCISVLKLYADYESLKIQNLCKLHFLLCNNELLHISWTQFYFELALMCPLLGDLNIWNCSNIILQIGSVSNSKQYQFSIDFKLIGFQFSFIALFFHLNYPYEVEQIHSRWNRKGCLWRKMLWTNHSRPQKDQIISDFLNRKIILILSFCKTLSSIFSQKWNPLWIK